MGSEERICRLEKLSGILSMIISSSTNSSSIDPPHWIPKISVDWSKAYP